MLMAAQRLEDVPALAAMAGTQQGLVLLDELHNRSWYVLLIEPQQEIRVFVALKSYRLKVRLPVVPHITTRGMRRTKVTVYRPMMRGYLFIREESVEQFCELRRPLPVHGFLRFGDCIATVTEADLDRVARIEEELARPKPFQSMWGVGEVARVQTGPFTGLNVTITDLYTGERIRVDVSLFGRAVPTTLHSDDLEKL